MDELGWPRLRRAGERALRRAREKAFGDKGVQDPIAHLAIEIEDETSLLGREREAGKGPEFVASLPPGARLIGIDVGTKTLGLALSDATRTIASSLVTLRRSRLSNDLHQLLELTQRHGAGGFVVGLPLNLDGSAGPRVQATRAFVRNLAKATPLPVLYWDERLSTVAAERTLLEADLSRKRRAEVVDKVAATLILQGALDRMGRLRLS